MKNKQSRKKRAKILLNNLKEWIDVIPDHKLIVSIEKDLEISFLEGKIQQSKRGE